MGWRDSPLARDVAPQPSQPPVGIGASPSVSPGSIPNTYLGVGITKARPRWQSSPTLADLRSGKAQIIDQPYRDIEAELSDRGAPAEVRHAVGGAKTEADRLATLQRFTGGASPAGWAPGATVQRSPGRPLPARCWLRSTRPAFLSRSR